MGLGNPLVLALALGQPSTEGLGVLTRNIDHRVIRGLGEISLTQAPPRFLRERLIVANPRFPDGHHQVLPERNESHGDAVLPRLSENDTEALFERHFRGDRLAGFQLEVDRQRLVTLPHQIELPLAWLHLGNDKVPLGGSHRRTVSWLRKGIHIDLYALRIGNEPDHPVVDLPD